PNSAPVCLDDAVCYRQTHTAAGRLAVTDVSITHGAEEFLKASFAQVFTNPGAFVFDAEEDVTFILRSCANPDWRQRRRVSSRVIDQSINDLRYRRFIDFDQRQLLFDPDFDLMSAGARFRPLECHGDDLIDRAQLPAQ